MYTVPKRLAPLRPNSKPLKDRKYLSWLHEVRQPACFCCGREYFRISQSNRSEIHHAKENSSDARNDHYVYMLCGEECHRLGTVLSAHGTPRLFRETFSIEYQRAYAAELYQEYKNENT